MVNQGVNLSSARQLFGHSAITQAMSCKHAIVDSRPAAVAKFAGSGDNFATGRTKVRQLKEGLSPNAVIRYNAARNSPRRGGREAEGGGLLIYPALFVHTTFHLF